MRPGYRQLVYQFEQDMLARCIDAPRMSGSENKERKTGEAYSLISSDGGKPAGISVPAAGQTGLIV
jgi:hypothetical protein